MNVVRGREAGINTTQGNGFTASQPTLASCSIATVIHSTSTAARLMNLKGGEHEQALYDDLRKDRLGDRVRLEQERVKYQLVEEVVLALHH